MSDPSCAFPACAFDDDFDRAFPGSKLTHLLSITAADPLAAALTALTALHESGGRLESLNLHRQGEDFDYRLVVSDLRASVARSLAATLLDLPGVERAHVEHRLLRGEPR